MNANFSYKVCTCVLTLHLSNIVFVWTHCQALSFWSILSGSWSWEHREKSVRKHRPALSCPAITHSAVYVGKFVCTCTCMRVEFSQGLKDAIQTQSPSSSLIAMQSSPAAYARPWRLKYLPLCSPGTSWLTPPRDTHSTPPSCLILHPENLISSLSDLPFCPLSLCPVSVCCRPDRPTTLLSIMDSLNDRF